MESKLCYNCGKKFDRNEITTNIEDNLWCYKCTNLQEDVKLIQMTIPQDIVFKSAIAKFGKGRRIIEIPKKQRDFLSTGKEYIVIIKDPEGGK